MATSSSSSPTGDSAPNTPPHDLPPDPLLQPGSFIDANGEPEPQLAGDEPDPANKDSTPPPPRRGGAAVADETQERPPWLPDDWNMVFKVRESGATAGSVDRYYIEPVTGRRFRSKNEVEFFLQTGTKRKKSDAAADAQPSESSAGGKKKKSGSGSKNGRPAPLTKFDFNNIPEMTTWKLKDASKDIWMPFIDGKMVPKSVKQEWDAAFQALASGNLGPM